LAGVSTPSLSSYIGGITNDGVWCNAKCVGSNALYPQGIYLAGRNKGNVLVHEVGHWLGLRHIWGDAPCGDDFCNDTPTAGTSNSGYSTHPLNIGSCPGNTVGEMFFNYMDYSDDSCTTMFTFDQNVRMQTALQYGVYRNFLNQSSALACGEPPSAPTATFNVNDTLCNVANYTIVNSSFDNPLAPLPISYTWSAIPSIGVNFTPSNTATDPTVSFNFPGTYLVQLDASNLKGSSTAFKTIEVISCVITSAFEHTNGQNKIKVYSVEKSIVIDNQTDLNCTFKINDVYGRTLFTSHSVPEGKSIYQINTNTNFFLYNLFHNDQVIKTGKLIVGSH
jgi:hypothetical protein